MTAARSIAVTRSFRPPILEPRPSSLGSGSFRGSSNECARTKKSTQGAHSSRARRPDCSVRDGTVRAMTAAATLPTTRLIGTSCGTNYGPDCGPSRVSNRESRRSPQVEQPQALRTRLRAACRTARTFQESFDVDEVHLSVVGNRRAHLARPLLALNHDGVGAGREVDRVLTVAVGDRRADEVEFGLA